LHQINSYDILDIIYNKSCHYGDWY